MKTLYKPYIYLCYLLIYLIVFPVIILLATSMVLAMLIDDWVMIYRAPLKGKLPRGTWLDPFRRAWPTMRAIIGKVFG